MGNFQVRGRRQQALPHLNNIVKDEWSSLVMEKRHELLTKADDQKS